MHHFIQYKTIIVFLVSMVSMASSANDIVISEAQMPEMPPISRTAAIYLTLHNTSAIDYELIGVSTSIAQQAMIHQTMEHDDIVKMNHVNRVLVEANKSIKLAAGGTHIMLMGLKKHSIPNPFEIKLIFKSLEHEDSGLKNLEVQVHKEQTVLVNIIKRQK